MKFLNSAFVAKDVALRTFYGNQGACGIGMIRESFVEKLLDVAQKPEAFLLGEGSDQISVSVPVAGIAVKVNNFFGVNEIFPKNNNNLTMEAL